MKTFRFLAALIMAVVCVGLSSCSKDDDEKIGSTDDLVGKWEQTWTKGWEIDSDGLKDTWDEADSGDFLIFKTDGTGRMETAYDRYPFTWKFENNNFTWDYSLYEGCTTKIIKLDSKSLVLEITEKDSQEINTYKRISSEN